jgi:hypothetical protein
MLAAGLVVVLVVSAVLIGTAESPASDTLAFELRKYIIQFLLIVALGAVVAFLVVTRRGERSPRKRIGGKNERQRTANVCTRSTP